MNGFASTHQGCRFQEFAVTPIKAAALYYQLRRAMQLSKTAEQTYALQTWLDGQAKQPPAAPGTSPELKQFFGEIGNRNALKLPELQPWMKLPTNAKLPKLEVLKRWPRKLDPAVGVEADHRPPEYTEGPVRPIQPMPTNSPSFHKKPPASGYET